MKENFGKPQVVFTNKARCQDCYRCIRACPVKAIKMKEGQASVQKDRCIDCGTCIRECPQGAKTYRNDVEHVKLLLQSNMKVAVSLAPSFAGVYADWERTRIASALRKLGFQYVAETAIGAGEVAQYIAQIVNQNGFKSYISSACPAVINYIEKYDIECIDSITPVASPMIAHARRIKAKMGDDCAIVFIGPCIAKKSEAERPEYEGLIEAVLTFDELNDLFKSEDINLAAFEESWFNEFPTGESRLYPLLGGLAKTAAMDTDILATDIISVSGFDELKQALDLVKNSSKNYIIEPLFCSMGCVNGPGVNSEKNILNRRMDVINYSNSRQLYTIEPEKIDIDLSAKYYQFQNSFVQDYPEDEIIRVLEKTGHASEQDQFNCNACGYDTCREKAIAVLSGMAEIDMCMPYMRRFAEMKSDQIIESSPNGIVILDEHFKIIHMNPAFRKFFMCSESTTGKPISYLMDPEPFYKLSSSEEDIIETTESHDNYGIICHEKLYKLKDERQYVGIFVNITKNVSDQTELDEIKAKTIKQAQELLNHQIDMAQNIAKLLGESSAKGEELVENLMKLSQDEEKKSITGDNSKNKNWIWDTYTSK